MATKNNFFQTSDGLWLYYESYGTGDPIVFIPGFGESTSMWKYSIQELSQQYNVICLDLRGHGRSMKVAGNNRQLRMAQDIRELIEYLKLKNVLLIGHSLGGAVVATYADTQNEYNLRGMIMADASLYAFSDEKWNEHKGHGYNIDAWLTRMKPYINSPFEYAKAYKSKLPLTPEDSELMYESLLSLPPWVGIEYHLDTYFYDNMTPLSKRKIPLATFVTHSAYHDAWESGHEAIKRAKSSKLALCYEFTQCNHHLFPIIEHKKFNECIIDFDNKIKNL